MNEQELLEQYERTGNLMDLFQNGTWVREMVRQENEAGCDIGAGVEWGANLDKVFVNPGAAQDLVLIRLMIVRSLKNLLIECNLGTATSAAIERGKTLLMEKIQNPSPILQTQLLSLLENPNRYENCSDIKALVRSLLTEEEWEQIAQFATNEVLELREVKSI